VEELNMHLIREEVGDVAVVKPEGDFIDGSNARAFRTNLSALCGGDTCVLLDLGGVRWVDSGGCGALLACCKELRERGGDLKLCGVTGPVRSLFQVIQLHRICDIFNSVEEGVAAFDVEAVTY
jgi:anti-sigma B factor antagonist